MAASAFAVESANIVGYQEVYSGTFQLVTPNFEKIDKSALTLADFTVAGTWDPGSDKIICYTGANKDYEATFLDAGILADIGEAFPELAGLSAGWYDYDDFASLGATEGTQVLKCYNTREVAFGNSGFAIQCSAPILFKGEVKQAAQQIQSDTFKLVGNCTPVNYTLVDFLVAGTWDPGSDKIICYTGANKDYEATFLDAGILADIGEAFPELAGLSAGWYDYDDFASLGATEGTQVLKCYNTRPVNAGSGFAIQCSAAISVPNPVPAN